MEEQATRIERLEKMHHELREQVARAQEETRVQMERMMNMMAALLKGKELMETERVKNPTSKLETPSLYEISKEPAPTFEGVMMKPNDVTSEDNCIPILEKQAKPYTFGQKKRDQEFAQLEESLGAKKRRMMNEEWKDEVQAIHFLHNSQCPSPHKPQNQPPCHHRTISWTGHHHSLHAFNQPHHMLKNQKKPSPNQDKLRFVPIPISHSQLYPKLLENKLVAPVFLRPRQPPYPTWYNANSKCEYHSNVVGHSIENCTGFKYKVQKLMRDGFLKFEKK